MAYALDNITTGDQYTTASTLTWLDAATLELVVANAPIFARFQPYNRSAPDQALDFGPELRIPPRARIYKGVCGVMVRSAVSGSPAQVTANLYLEEASPAADAPFDLFVGASGAVGVTYSLAVGDIFWSANAAGAVDRPGALVANGRSCDAVADPSLENLYNAIGLTFGGTAKTDFWLPDLLDRVQIGAGRNTALGANDGVTGVNRHGTRHRHTPHTHALTHQFVYENAGVLPNTGGGKDVGNPVIASADGGSGIASDPLDGPAFLGLVPFIVKGS